MQRDRNSNTKRHPGRKMTGVLASVSHQFAHRTTIPVLLILVWTMAGGNCDQGLPGGPLAPGDLTYYTNSTDPLLLSTTTDAGEKLEVYGAKDANGLPIGVDGIRYQTPEQVGTDEGTWLEFDMDGRLTKIVGADGSQIELIWESATVATVVAVDGDGETQLNFTFDLDANSGRARHDDASHVVDRLGLPTTLEVLNGSTAAVPSFTTAKSFATASSNEGRILVDVFRCEKTVDGAVVTVFYGTPGAAFGTPVRARPTGRAGEYEAYLPTAGRPQTKLESICDALPMALGNFTDNVCKAKSGIAPGVDVALCASLAAAGPPGFKAAGLCLVASRALDVYCGAVGAGSTEDFANVLCNKIKELEDRAPQDTSAQWEVRASADLPGTASHISESRVVSALGNFPKLIVDFEDQLPSIGRFFTAPSNPAPSQSYVATAELTCIPSGTVLRISVIGSDQFTRSHQITVDESNPNPTLQLTVPGAAAEVRDEITVEAVGGILILGPLGSTTMELKRQIEVFF